jgi:hypothetical protein
MFFHYFFYLKKHCELIQEIKVSRFDKPLPQPEAKEHFPVIDKGTIAASQSSEASNMRVISPPITREPSIVRSLHQDEVLPPPPPSSSSSLSAHPGNASLASSRSSGQQQRSGNRWSNDTRDQPQEFIALPPAPDPPSLSYRLSNDKSQSRVRQHPPPMSLGGGRDEGEVGEVELSFHNAHAELKREQEEKMIQQERLLERPQVQRRGASLLDRLSTGTTTATANNNLRSHDSPASAQQQHHQQQQQSLRDRLVPSKRDYEDMADDGMRQHQQQQQQHRDVSFDGEDGGIESKRPRRKNGRARTRGGRRGPAA